MNSKQKLRDANERMSAEHEWLCIMSFLLPAGIASGQTEKVHGEGDAPGGVACWGPLLREL